MHRLKFHRFPTNYNRNNYNIHSLQRLQTRTLFDVIFLKTFGSSLLNRIAVEYAYNKYLGLFKSVSTFFTGKRSHYEDLSHYAIPLLRRSNKQLISLDDSIIKLKHQYNILSYMDQKQNSDTSNADDIMLILNIGKKKQGKSLNTTICSMMLSNDGGCIFPINLEKGNDLQTTFGCDISPPLPLIQPLPRTHLHTDDIGNIKYLSFIDIEGINLGHKDNSEDIIKFVKDVFIDRYPCILILSSLLAFEEDDVLLLERLYENVGNKQRNPLILALNSPNISDIEYSSNYLRIKDEIGENFKLCQLPFFDENRKENARKYRKELMNELPYKTPLKYMNHSEKTCYFNLSVQILQTISQCNENGNYLGVSNKDMLNILGNIAQSMQLNEAIVDENMTGKFHQMKSSEN